jgi:hypothetical protein
MARNANTTEQLPMSANYSIAKSLSIVRSNVAILNEIRSIAPEILLGQERIDVKWKWKVQCAPRG